MPRTTEGLQQRVLSGLGWSVMAQVVFVATRFGIGVVLAHLLSPADYGVAGMAFVFTNLLATFNDLSFGAALVQRSEISEADRSTAFWSTVAVGVLLTVIGVAGSGAVASFFHQPRVGPLFAVLSITFTLTGLTATQVSLLNRDLAYRSLQIREMVAVVAGAVAALAVASAGLGPWAIVAQALAAAAVSVVLLWSLSPWRPRFIFAPASVRDLGGFALKLFSSRILNYAYLNADNLLVGRFLGGRALGAYSLAFNVMYSPVQRIALPLGQVLFPALSRLQNDPARLGAAWLRAKRLAAAVLALPYFVMLVAAPDLVPVVFGAKWHAAVPVLQLLGATGVAQSLVMLNWPLLEAQGHAGLLFRRNLLYTTVAIAAFALGLRWGIVGVAACYAVARWVLVLPDMAIAARSVSLPTARALRVSATALPLCTGASLLAFGLRALLLAAGVPAAARLGAVLVFLPLAYLGLIAVAAPDMVREVIDLRRSGRPAASSATSQA